MKPSRGPSPVGCFRQYLRDLADGRFGSSRARLVTFMKPSNAAPIRVVLADDHDLVRSGIKALLSMMEGVTVIAEARSGIELLAVLESLQPDIVMTDISMPGMD